MSKKKIKPKKNKHKLIQREIESTTNNWKLSKVKQIQNKKNENH